MRKENLLYVNEDILIILRRIEKKCISLAQKFQGK